MRLNVVLGMGTLPEMLEMTLTIAGVDGILGTVIFDYFKACFSKRRNQIIVTDSLAPAGEG